MQSKAKEYHLSGLRLYGDKRYPEAISEFNKGLRLSDDKVKAELMDSKAAAMNRVEAWRNHAYELANRLCLEFGDKNFRPWYRKADILHTMGLHSKSLTSLKQAWNLVKPDPAATQERQKKSKQARELITKLQEKIIEDRRSGGELALAKEREAEERIKEEEIAREKARRAALKAKINFVHLLSGDNLIAIAQHGMVEDPLFALRMSHVSRGWRDVVVGQPGLWSKLILGAKRPVVFAALWSKNSNNRITDLEFKSDFPQDRAVTVQDKLGDSLSDLTNLTINVEFDPHWMLTAWRGRFRSLEKLSIKTTANFPLSMQLDGGLIHPEGTRLRHLSISGKDILYDRLLDDEEDDKDVVWMPNQEKILAGLSTVDLRCYTSPLHTESARPHHLDLLRLTPNITSFSSIMPWSSTQPEIRKRFTLDSLATYVEPAAITEPTFERCTAPNLTSVSLWANQSQSVIPHILAPGLKSAMEKLRYLDIGKTTFETRELLRALRPMTSLQFLNVSLCAVDNDFLLALEYRPDDEKHQLLPALTALSIAGCNDISGGPLLKVYKSRSRLPGTVVPKFDLTKGIKRTSSFGRPTPPTKKHILSRSSSTASSSTPSSQNVNPSQNAPLEIISSLENLPTLLPTSQIASSQSTIHTTPSQLNWLCIDHCDRIEGEAVAYLRSKLNFLSWGFSQKTVDERMRGVGRYAWDADWKGGCRKRADDGEDGCVMRRIPGTKLSDNKFYVHHKCPQHEEIAVGEDTSWMLASKASLEKLEKQVAKRQVQV